MEETGFLPQLMRFLPLLATILMLIYWIYNYYNPMEA